MNPTSLQRWVDDLLATSVQQWLLRVATILTPLAALLAAGVAGGRWLPFWTIVVAGLATASAIRPDAHTPLLVTVIVGPLWPLTVDDLDTPWLAVAAVCLFAFHALTALLASLPTGGSFPATVLVRAGGRAGLVAAATVAMWGLVVALDRRDAAGNGLLTGLGLLVVAVAAALLWWRSVDRPSAER